MEQFRASLGECTREYGYDPDRQGSIGQKEIAPGEANWRECAYGKVREVLAPESEIPEAYETLIALDRVMTRDIESGRRTRDERRERILGMLDDILAKEKAPKQEDKPAMTESEMEQMHKEFMAREREMKRMRRIQSMMR